MAADDSTGLHLALALDVANIGVWEWNPALDIMNCDLRTRTLFELPAAAGTLESFLTRVHAMDRVRVRRTLRDALRDGGHYRCECRSIRTNSEVEPWIEILARAHVVDVAARHVLGIAMDVSVNKAEDLRRELLSDDTEHRMTNMFSVVSAIVSLSQGTASTAEEFATGLRTRLSALARAYSMHTVKAPGSTVNLQQIVGVQIAPFAVSAQVTVDGPPIELGRRQALAMNMIFHELATNAVKYGALSPEGGQVTIQWSHCSGPQGECVLLSWKEICRSRISSPARSGLGSKILASSARYDLGGDIIFDYQSDGLLATLVVPTARLTTPVPAKRFRSH